MSYGVPPALFDIAAWQLNNANEKQAFVPSDPAAAGGDPMAAGGMPPGADPAMAGGGATPMDPMAAGGAGPPGMDPMAGGAGGAPGAPLDPMMIQQIVQAVLQQTGGGAAGGPAGAAGPGKGSAKVDPGLIYMELGRVRKLLTGMYQNLDWELPPDILDDAAVAQSVIGGQPAGQPLPAGGAPAGGDPAAAAGGGAPGLPAVGQSGAINPIEPVGQEAAPGKMANDLRTKAGNDVMSMLGLAASPGKAVSPQDTSDKIDALAALIRSYTQD